ncbi:hypothetical protein [Streptomyces antibioticus]|uniref:Uncharacterized protein n=1 Tax=Streptomyces antibioticus TaxID=1890 RepID=A0AAE7CP14_STRAT|nr:hypothetical protein [Streptomyces antibioticus]OOQ46987.1 hypothetical protein AFM16_29800 [Streptomyces antibioticus]QIT47288.1 hypothetical protein HCX60_30335 [Streptomyces antibioticus]
MAGRSPEEPADGSSISDEALRAFLEESEARTAAAPKEPSARARMVTERLRQQDARGETPAAWRTAPDAAARRVRRGKIWSALGVAACVALLAVALKPSLIPGDPFGRNEPEAVTEPLPAETARPTEAPEDVPRQVPTLDRPFAGSPALRWADGEAGILLPDAKPVGKEPKERVAEALELTRKLLIAANLDPKSLRGERPTAALSVLDPKQPELLDRLNASLRAPSKTDDPLLMFSRFDPDEVKVVGDVVKTRGRITFGKGKNGGVAVHADYTFVYPVVRADGSVEVTRTIVRRVLDVELPDPAHYDVTAGRLLVVRYDEEAGNSACDVYDGFLHPHFPTTPGSSAESTGPAQTGPTVDPYDRRRDIGEDRDESCGSVSRV